MSLYSFSRALQRAARQQQAAERVRLRTAQANHRNQERNRKAQERLVLSDAKNAQRIYLEGRVQDTSDKNDDLEELIRELNNILAIGLGSNPTLDFAKMLAHAVLPKLSLGELAEPLQSPMKSVAVKPSSFFGWLPWVRQRYETTVAQLKQYDASSLADYESKESARQAAIRSIEIKHAKDVQLVQSEVDRKNSELTVWKAAIETGDVDAVAECFMEVLENSEYPDGFPKSVKAIYVATSKQLIVEYDLPLMQTVIPTVKIYKYVKASDSISETPRPELQRRSLYSSVVAQTTLRCVWELFAADGYAHLDTIVFNGYVTRLTRVRENRLDHV